MNKAILFAAAIALLVSCKKETNAVIPGSTNNHNLVFKFKFDSTQERLNGFGQPAPLPAGNAGQSPVFNAMSAHYIELAPTAFTQLGGGAILYRAEETTMGGSKAIDFSKAKLAGNGEAFFSIPLKDIKAGEYEWLRVSIAYQNYIVKFSIDTTINGLPFINQEGTTTVASFIGFNSYISNFKIANESMTVNGNRKQGFWATESSFSFSGFNYTRQDSGQAPGTTVVNPISSSSPIPAGSCVVTGKILPGKLAITGNETKDIVVEVSLSTNKSFEWKEVILNGKWDVSKNERVVDMGVRGMIPTVK